MSLLTSAAGYSLALQTKLTDPASTGVTGLQAVYYGDQDKIPTTPVACVEPGPKSKQYKGVGRMSKIELTVFIYIYITTIQSPQLNLQQAVAVGELVEGQIDADPLLRDVHGDQQLIDSLVRLVEPGFKEVAGSVYRTARLTVVGQSQLILPMG
jgi:hypothetical protein